MGKKPAKAKGDRSYTSLAKHKRHKKVLIPPLNQLPGAMKHSSWINERLPEFIWAALLAGNLERDRYLAFFRSVIGAAQEFRETKAFIGHSGLAKIGTLEFEAVFRVVLSDADAIEALAPLLLLENLPDFKHWQVRLRSPRPDDDWTALGKSVARCMDHQSQVATDIRWLKVAFLTVQDRVHMPPWMVDDIAGYPNSGDQRRVRPSIRAMEISLAAPDMIPETVWPATFWNDCWHQTLCKPQATEVPQIEFPSDEVNRAFGMTYAQLGMHCFNTIEHTDVDARHDTVFGLAMYGLLLIGSLFRPYSTRPVGRIVLRSVVEVFINLSYLLKLDNAELWQKYRSYGSGQAKLAFLKMAQSNAELPKYVGIETLEALANADMWQEFVDISVGHWAGKDLRRMSEEAGVKEVYDLYYDWPSTFVHGQWPAVRNSVFGICANPLHRFHRLPGAPNLRMEDVSWDGVALGNKLLDLVDRA